jgi:hypothetical protein
MKLLPTFILLLLSAGLLPGQGEFGAQSKPEFIQKNRIHILKTFEVKRDLTTNSITEKKLLNSKFYDASGHLTAIHTYKGEKDTLIATYRFNEATGKSEPLSGGVVKVEKYIDSLGREVARTTMPHLSVPDQTMTLETIYDPATGIFIENFYDSEKFSKTQTGRKDRYTKVLYDTRYDEKNQKWDTLSTQVDFFLGDLKVFTDTRYHKPDPFLGNGMRDYKVYDDLGRMVASFLFSQNGKRFAESRWQYDDQGNLISFTMTTNGVETSRNDNIMDESGLIVSTMATKSYGEINTVREYAYEYVFFERK